MEGEIEDLFDMYIYIISFAILYIIVLCHLYLYTHYEVS